ncbi:hypothetical protein [Rubritalea tangerina]|uniref:hypothetical protein n=1 Tax=Rubritalea tangerina TaxID=430798 RepID=UPI00361BCA3B
MSELVPLKVASSKYSTLEISMEESLEHPLKHSEPRPLMELGRWTVVSSGQLSVLGSW